jgi:cysteine desulfurase
MENLPGVMGMAAALTASLGTLADRAATQWALTATLRERIDHDVPGATVHGHPTHRAPHLVCFSVEGVNPETLMMTLDDRGFALGAGSTCSGQPSDPSPVLQRIGVPNTGGFRIGLTDEATEADVERLVEALADAVHELRAVERASAEALGRYRGPPGTAG